MASNVSLDVIIKAVWQGGNLDKGAAEVQKITGATGQFGAAASLASVAGAAAFAAIGSAAVQFAQESIQSFQTFEQGMAEVFTLMPGMSQQAMDQMSSQVMDFSAGAGRLPEETIAALYESLSAGVPADNVFEFMSVASDTAVGGVTDLATAVDGLTSVVNAYGAENVDAREAADVMFTAVKIGKMTMDDLSKSMYNVVPTAASMGVSLQDVAANLAVITSQGVPASVATTQLRQALIEASKEGTKLSDAIMSVTGSSFTELIAKGQTTSEILDTVRSSMPDQEFRDLFGSVEALNATLAITGPNADATASAFDQMADSTGSVSQAAATMRDTGVQSAKEYAAAVENLKIVIGEGLSPAVESLQGGMATLAENAATVATALMGGYSDSIRQATTDNIASADSFDELADSLANVAATAQESGNTVGMGDALVDSQMRISQAMAMSSESFDEWAAGIKESGVAVADLYSLSNEEWLQAMQNGGDMAAFEEQMLRGLYEQLLRTGTGTKELADNLKLGTLTTRNYAEEVARTINYQQQATIANNATLGVNIALETSLEELANSERELTTSTQANVTAGRLAADSYMTQKEAAQQAAAELAELIETNEAFAAATGDTFVSVLDSAASGTEAIGFFNESLNTLAQTSVTVGGRTQEQNAQLDELQDAYDKAAEKISDYELGLTGVSMSEEERAKKIEEQTLIMQNAQAAMQPLLDITGEQIAVNNELSVNQEAVNQAIFDSAAASDASAVELAILGGALGLYSQEAVDAALKTALIQAEIDRLTQLYLDGKMGVDEMKTSLNNFIAEIEEGVTVLPSGQVAIGAIGDTASVAAGKIDEIAESAGQATTALQNIPTEIGVNVTYTSDPFPDVPSGGGGSQTPGGKAGEPQGGFAMGGWTGSTGGTVHPNELVTPQSVLAQGSQAVLDFAAKNVPGFKPTDTGRSVVIQSGAIIIYQYPGMSAEATASAVMDQIGRVR